MTDPVLPITPPPTSQTQTTSRLKEVAQDLEASFLAEMLKHAGLGKPRESFGGGAGEDQFASLLIETQARAIVDAGGIGLAESIFQSLKDKADA
ncbi:rod-binding protein [Shimia sp. FJ5]|uniref:rod-binding protein n=1 Tax=Shimia sp. FJ5 TaxID=3079054 RepID=UPI002629807B|nr:rod-binding protein [Shimia sp. FJ5]MDV4144723.1 rod-binding protein [Shimia sp. FJ5]